MLSTVCCLDTQLCKCQCLGLTRNKNVKLAYVLLLVLSYFVMTLANAITPVDDNTIMSYGCETVADKQECLHDKNALIIFGGVAVLHLILLCCMFCKTDKVKVINQGMWLIKIFIIALFALFLRLLVGTTFFTYLGYFSVWGSNLLFFFEALVFIDLVYSLDSYLDECAQQNNKIYVLKAIISITVLIAAAFLCFLSFHQNNYIVCWANAGLLAIFFILAVLRIFPGNSILVASVISLCLNILGFYIPNDQSQPASAQLNLFLLIFRGLFIIFLLLGMLCPGSSKLRTRKSTLNQLLALNTTQTEQDNRYVSSNKWTVYHYIMMVIGLTIPAALTLGASDSQQITTSWTAIANMSWWGSILLLYIWSLICCKLFPEKDFSDLQNYFREYELQ